MAIERVAILGTGLIGASVGLALRSHGFTGSITGWAHALPAQARNPQFAFHASTQTDDQMLKSSI